MVVAKGGFISSGIRGGRRDLQNNNKNDKNNNGNENNKNDKNDANKDDGLDSSEQETTLSPSMAPSIAFPAPPSRTPTPTGKTSNPTLATPSPTTFIDWISTEVVDEFSLGFWWSEVNGETATTNLEQAEIMTRAIQELVMCPNRDRGVSVVTFPGGQNVCGDHFNTDLVQDSPDRMIVWNRPSAVATRRSAQYSFTKNGEPVLVSGNATSNDTSSTLTLEYIQWNFTYRVLNDSTGMDGVRLLQGGRRFRQLEDSPFYSIGEQEYLGAFGQNDPSESFGENEYLDVFRQRDSPSSSIRTVDWLVWQELQDELQIFLNERITSGSLQEWITSSSVIQHDYQSHPIQVGVVGLEEEKMLAPLVAVREQQKDSTDLPPGDYSLSDFTPGVPAAESLAMQFVGGFLAVLNVLMIIFLTEGSRRWKRRKESIASKMKEEQQFLNDGHAPHDSRQGKQSSTVSTLFSPEAVDSMLNQSRNLARGHSYQQTAQAIMTQDLHRQVSSSTGGGGQSLYFASDNRKSPNSKENSLLDAAKLTRVPPGAASHSLLGTSESLMNTSTELCTELCSSGYGDYDDQADDNLDFLPQKLLSPIRGSGEGNGALGIERTQSFRTTVSSATTSSFKSAMMHHDDEKASVLESK